MLHYKNGKKLNKSIVLIHFVASPSVWLKGFKSPETIQDCKIWYLIFYIYPQVKKYIYYQTWEDSMSFLGCKQLAQ